MRILICESDTAAVLGEEGLYDSLNVVLPFFLLSFFRAAVCDVFPASIIALARGKRDLLAIFLLNFFLGLTVIGWVVALIWAVKHDVPVVVR